MTFWSIQRNAYKNPFYKQDHIAIIKKTQSNIPLYEIHLLLTILMDPLLLETQHHSIVLMACRVISNLPLYGIRWLIRSFLTQPPEPNSNLIPLNQYPSFDAPDYIRTLPNHICTTNSNSRWNYVSHLCILDGPLDTELNSYIPRNDVAEDLKTITTTLQHFLTTWTVTDSNLEPVEPVIRTLSIIFSMNYSFSFISNKLFYNDSISTTLDIKLNFPKWKLKDGFSVCNYPFLLYPSIKADILRVESMVQMRHELQDTFFRAMFTGISSPYFNLQVRRDHLIRDALYEIENKNPIDLKKQLKVEFVGEEAIDEGGPQKEFYRLVIRDLFKEDYGLFRYFNDSRLWWFQIDDLIDSDCLKEYRLVGQLLGIAIYNGIHVNISFPLALYKKLSKESLDSEDLKMLDPQLYSGLHSLLALSNEELVALELVFVIEIASCNHLYTFELLPNGHQIEVNSSNINDYIRLYVDYYMNTSIKKAFVAFIEGFQLLTEQTALILFKAEELEELVCGQPELNFNDLQSITKYDGGFTETSLSIKWFWEIVHEFDDQDKKKLLNFTTSSDRVPTGGFSRMNFIISRNGGDTERVPTSHTCFNVLLLNEYSSKDKLKLKLLTAIRNAEGFGLL